MDRIDVIVCWPRSCDYPLWRQFIRDERHRFYRVLAMFTEHSGHDYSDWLRANCPDVEFVDSFIRDGDWRDGAVNAALDISTSNRVWFTEQDFFITDPSFWDAEGVVVGFNAGDGRPLHPASLFVNRDLIPLTSRYFGPEPVDHFYTFGTELCGLIEPTLMTSGFEHLQGTTQNHSLIDSGEDAGVFRRDRFRDYLRACLAADVWLEPGWAANARREILLKENRT